MSQIPTTRTFLWRPKYTVLLFAGVFAALLGLFFVLFDESSYHGVVTLAAMCSIRLSSHHAGNKERHTW